MAVNGLSICGCRRKRFLLLPIIMLLIKETHVSFLFFSMLFLCFQFFSIFDPKVTCRLVDKKILIYDHTSKVFFPFLATYFSQNRCFRKCDQIRSFLWIWSHLMKKYLMKNFLFLHIGL